MKALVANGLWWGATWPGAIAFDYARNRVESAQRTRLKSILDGCSHTRFGRLHGFGSIRDPEEYRCRVPIVEYADIEKDIQEIACGTHDVLFPGRPICFIPTSGSTGKGKLIPYTEALHNEFQAALAPWMFGLFRREPRMLGGRAYWSISPAGFQERTTPGGARIGFEDDTQYLHPILRGLTRLTMAVPNEVSQIRDVESFRYVTLAFLLLARDLRFISVWNPSFLTLLLARLSDWGERLVSDVRRGTLSPPTALGEPLHRVLEGRFGGPNPFRASELQAKLSCPSVEGEGLYPKLWPQLRIISCWADAAARRSVAELSALFPGVAIQPKGLLSTEGVVSFPHSTNRAPALAVRSHFYEFVPDSGSGAPVFAWQLEPGFRGQVVITTGGGLYRYRTGDMVEVVAIDGGCPLLEFIGRGDKVSDIFGEKLHEAHVAEVLDRLFPREPLRSTFALLAPDGPPDRYTLFIAGAEPPSMAERDALETVLERGLAENIHYEYCRRLGQLQSASICWLATEPQIASERFLLEKSKRGTRLGDIKPPLLENGRGWREILMKPSTPTPVVSNRGTA